jgi:DNA adenine methylase
MNIPHPIPYQGSKRHLAGRILRYFPKDVESLYEPFAGSAAISLAAAARSKARRFHINDLNKPLIDLWRAIVESPDAISDQYESLWNAQLSDPRAFYKRIRDEFNLTGRPDYFLYLLARCVKASVRYNSHGEFNQSPDNRRRGASPEVMRHHVHDAASLLHQRASFSSVNYRDALAHVGRRDLVYMDPPYQGVCRNRDTRYLGSVQFCEFVEVLDGLNSKRIRYIVSYDGRTGERAHGRMLPPDLRLKHMEIHAGRSTQATLLGRAESTYESLYLSPALVRNLERTGAMAEPSPAVQLALLE